MLNMITQNNFSISTFHCLFIYNCLLDLSKAQNLRFIINFIINEALLYEIKVTIWIAPHLEDILSCFEQEMINNLSSLRFMRSVSAVCFHEFSIVQRCANTWFLPFQIHFFPLLFIFHYDTVDTISIGLYLFCCESG